MSNARLISLSLERFKSYKEKTVIPLSPLTVVLGRNNSGKSSIIQALLLLKQTLSLPRSEVPLHLERWVVALSLRELTFGWPAAGDHVPGPKIGIRWRSFIDLDTGWGRVGSPDLNILQRHTGWDWLGHEEFESPREIEVELALEYAEHGGQVRLQQIELRAAQPEEPNETRLAFTLVRRRDSSYECLFGNTPCAKIGVELDHFIPYLNINKGKGRKGEGGPGQPERAREMTFQMVFAPALEDLKGILIAFSYLGPMRTPPFSLYAPVTVPPEEIGANGEYAAQMLYAHRLNQVHYLPPLDLTGDGLRIPTTVYSKTLVDAVNDVLASLGIDASLRIEDIKNIGFQLLFGKAQLQHVGRGLSYLLPVIQLGLLADPMRFQGKSADIPLEEYKEACPGFAHCAFEELESHLHPKVQSRLAHWLVALAMAKRQMIVETHSDHLVRRLRGLAARAVSGSDFEQWLLQNVSILHIDQVDGVSTLKKASLTSMGQLEEWPADFMDEATDEERSIYDRALFKDGPPPAELESPDVEHDVGEEPDTGP